METPSVDPCGNSRFVEKGGHAIGRAMTTMLRRFAGLSYGLVVRVPRDVIYQSLVENLNTVNPQINPTAVQIFTRVPKCTSFFNGKGQMYLQDNKWMFKMETPEGKVITGEAVNYNYATEECTIQGVSVHRESKLSRKKKKPKKKVVNVKKSIEGMISALNAHYRKVFKVFQERLRDREALKKQRKLQLSLTFYKVSNIVNKHTNMHKFHFLNELKKISYESKLMDARKNQNRCDFIDTSFNAAELVETLSNIKSNPAFRKQQQKKNFEYTPSYVSRDVSDTDSKNRTKETSSPSKNLKHSKSMIPKEKRDACKMLVFILSKKITNKQLSFWLPMRSMLTEDDSRRFGRKLSIDFSAQVYNKDELEKYFLSKQPKRNEIELSPRSNVNKHRSRKCSVNRVINNKNNMRAEKVQNKSGSAKKGGRFQEPQLPNNDLSAIISSDESFSNSQSFMTLNDVAQAKKAGKTPKHFPKFSIDISAVQHKDSFNYSQADDSFINESVRDDKGYSEDEESDSVISEEEYHEIRLTTNMKFLNKDLGAVSKELEEIQKMIMSNQASNQAYKKLLLNQNKFRYQNLSYQGSARSSISSTDDVFPSDKVEELE